MYANKNGKKKNQARKCGQVSHEGKGQGQFSIGLGWCLCSTGITLHEIHGIPHRF
jgi:hypothetical protein